MSFVFQLFLDLQENLTHHTTQIVESLDILGSTLLSIKGILILK